jgi:DNA-binding MarR family transcriptional regulator
MRIEEIIKPTSPMAIEKRTLLNVMYTQNVVSEKFNEILKPFDLSSEQFNVLRILRGQKGNPVNMCTIQARMIAKTSNTTRLVDKLLLKDLVIREICPINRRKMEITITDKGIKLLKQLDPLVESNEKAFAKNLTNKELELLNELLEKFRN